MSNVLHPPQEEALIGWVCELYEKGLILYIAGYVYQCRCVSCNVALCPGMCRDAWHGLSHKDRRKKKTRYKLLDFDVTTSASELE